MSEGTLAGRYAVQQRLGAGAMGVVYRARDLQTGQDVALKLLQRTHAPRSRARLLREAEVTQALDHPGVVRVLRACESERGPLLVCELVPDSISLDRALPKFELERRLDLFREIVAALAHAHERGVVHRDLKPSNVLVDRQGQARVIDFGVGCLSNAETLTQTGALAGTPAYMAPEQITGQPSARRPTADVWALGVLLYELLTDALPFTGDSLVELAAQVTVGRYRRPQDLKPTTPPALNAVVARCLVVDPAERLPDARALLRSLDEALAGPARRSGAGPAPGVLLAAGAILAAGVLGALLVVSRVQGGPQPGSPPPAAPPAGSSAAPSPETDYGPGASPELIAQAERATAAADLGDHARAAELYCGQLKLDLGRPEEALGDLFAAAELGLWLQTTETFARAKQALGKTEEALTHLEIGRQRLALADIPPPAKAQARARWDALEAELRQAEPGLSADN